MKICIPSKNRARNIRTPKVFKSAWLFVPESEVPAYKKNGWSNLIGVPEAIKGITQTRNFILDTFQNENIIMIDDDIKEFGYYKKGKAISFFKKDWEEILLKEFDRLFDVCKELDFKIWGCESGGSKSTNHPLTPFTFKGSINASFIGIINDGEYRFDESYKVKEDYELIMRHFKEKGGHLKVNHFYVKFKHWSNSGGCVDYRTDELEQQSINKLKKQFCGMVSKSRFENQNQIHVSWV